MSTSMDETYARVVRDLPEALRPVATRLLVEVGMAQGQACRWDEVFQLEPCRQLPRFALEEDRSTQAQTLEAFLQAHHCACFHGVLMDRLADRQAVGSPELTGLAEQLLARWRLSLVEATRGGATVERSLFQSLRAWRWGVRLEQAALARRRLTPRRYARVVLLKLGWAGLSTEWLLRHVGQTRRAPLFRRAYFTLMLAMQCMDDAVDAPEDEALHGTSIPAALGVSRAQLFRAGAWLTRAAVEPARQGGFSALARWLSARAEELKGLHPWGSSIGEDLGGYALASLLEETCRRSAH